MRRISRLRRARSSSSWGTPTSPSSRCSRRWSATPCASATPTPGSCTGSPASATGSPTCSGDRRATGATSRAIRSHGPGTLVGRVGLERRAVQIADVLADPEYRWRAGRELGGFRTTLGVPMLASDGVVGVLALWRARSTRSTTGRSTRHGVRRAGAMAIRKVELLQELEQRSSSSHDGRGAEALREVGQAVSSSLDLDQVLATIVTRAVELSGTDGGSILEYDRRRGCSWCAPRRHEPELVATCTRTRIHLDETFVGRAAATRRAAAGPDLDAEPPRSPHRAAPPPRAGGRCWRCRCCGRTRSSAR